MKKIIKKIISCSDLVLSIKESVSLYFFLYSTSLLVFFIRTFFIRFSSSESSVEISMLSVTYSGIFFFL